jgi:hypothetical protein
MKANTHISYHPLREDLRKKFNKTKALEFYKTVDGKPYGMKNFFFAGIDTTSSNLPLDYPFEFFPILFSILGKINPGLAQMVAGEGLSLRLGLTNKNMTIHEITVKAAKRYEIIYECFKSNYLFSISLTNINLLAIFFFYF